MYEAHFGLTDMPFRMGADPRLYVDMAPHRAAIRALHDAPLRGDDFTPLFGDFGSGKSTVARRMLQEADRARHVVGELRSMRIAGDGLLDGVTEALGLRSTRAIPPLGSLIQQLEALVRDGRHGLLLVDDAHELGLDGLTRLRKLAAVRIGGHAALHVILAGRAPPAGIAELQRIGRPLKMGPPVNVEALDARGTHDYILARLGRAGWTGRPAFDVRTTDEIHARCQGNPGRINRLCGHMLLQLFIERRDDTNPAVVRAVDELLRSELNGEPATITLPPVGDAGPVQAEAPEPSESSEPSEPPESPGSPEFLAPMEPLEPQPPPRRSEPPAASAGTTDLDLISLPPPAPPRERTPRPPGGELATHASTPPAVALTRGRRRWRPWMTQGVAAVILLVSGGALWQMISDRLGLRPGQQAVQASAAAALADRAEQTLARSPPAAGPPRLAAMPAAPIAPMPAVPFAAAARPAPVSPTPPAAVAPPAAVPPPAVVVPPTAAALPAAAVPLAATASTARSPGKAILQTQAQPRARSQPQAQPQAQAQAPVPGVAPVRPAAPRTTACTLEGEALGLCRRAPVPAPGFEPEGVDRTPDRVPNPPRPPSCDPTRQALALCAQRPPPTP